MKMSEYRSKVEELEKRKKDVSYVSTEHAFGYAKTVLDNALNRIEQDLTRLLNMDLEPKPYIITISNSPTSVSIAAGSTQQLTVTATLSNGGTKDVTKADSSVVNFRDYDDSYDNTGHITSASTSNFVFTDSRDFYVTKNTNGWDIGDSEQTQGLQVVATANTNEYELQKEDGTKIGVTFVTDGSEVVGDNFVLEVTVLPTGTTYSSSDETIATVGNDGLITGEAIGTADVTITNGNISRVVSVTVS